MKLKRFWDPIGLFQPAKQQKLQPTSITQPSTSDEGGYIGILFGTRDIQSLNYTYFGNVKSVAIKSKSGKK